MRAEAMLAGREASAPASVLPRWIAGLLVAVLLVVFAFGLRKEA